MKTAVIMDETKMKKRKLRFWLFFGFFATLLVAAIVCGIILGNHILKSDYEKLQTAIKNNDLSAMISLYKNDDLLDYEEAVVNYEKSFLGNSNANILQDGRICTYDDIVLDATNGSLVKIENNESKTLVNEPVGSTKYVLNTNTKKFHYPTCGSAGKIAAKNYAESNESRDSLIAKGYSPCGNCDP